MSSRRPFLAHRPDLRLALAWPGSRHFLLGGSVVLILLLALFILVRQSAPSIDARPALWHAQKGDRQIWLFGTIHSVPGNARWLSPAIAKAADGADWLWLEVTGLDRERDNLAIFDRLGRQSGLPPLPSRLSAEDRPGLARLAMNDRWLTHGLDGYESWAAALLISARASAASHFSSRNAGEALLSARFNNAGKPVAGLETIAGQLSFFDRLPQHEQDLLLAQAVQEAQGMEAQLQALYADWARGDTAALGRQFDNGLGRSALLRHVLVDARNAHWAEQIDELMARHHATPFIAVGAGHLVGSGSLQSRLEAKGWQVRQIQ